MSHDIRVLLVDDESLMRMGLRLILDGASGIEIVGEASSGAEAVTAVAELSPDVVLMDIRMPVLDGIEATAQIVAQHPEVRIIILTAFDTDGFILRGLRAGAVGFLLKDTAPDELVAAVKAAYAGSLSVSPAVLDRLLQLAGDGSQAAPRTDPLTGLSGREREIALAAAEGLTNSEIAERYFLSLTTVKTHLQRVFTKLDVNNRVQLALLVRDDRS